MRILSDAFVAAWQGRMLNIHPSLLPLYKGLDTHQRAIDAGDTAGGCSVHVVTPTLDDGRSEEHTSELQSLMRSPYAVFCLKKQITEQHQTDTTSQLYITYSCSRL